MKMRAIPAFTVTVGFLSVSMALFAHHGTAAFDLSKTLVMEGTVTEWYWSNPHCLLQFDAKNEDGQVVHWIAETQNPVDMVKRGWRKESFKPGDEVTVTLNPVKNGQPTGQIRLVVLPNGKTLDALAVPTSKVPVGSSAGAKSDNYTKQ